MIKKTLFTFFIVQLFTIITSFAGSIVDGIVTGSYLGTNALAAYGIVMPFLTILTALATAASVGISSGYILFAELFQTVIPAVSFSVQSSIWVFYI